MNDLVVLVADKDMKFGVSALLSRSHTLGLRRIESDVYVHPEHDSSCLLRPHEFLRSFLRRYSNALVMLDREGCGQEHLSRERLELQVESRLAANGWNGRAAAIIIDPELEVWVWSDSPHVDVVLGWGARDPDLRAWLVARGYTNQRGEKPRRPKEAVREALRFVHKPPSSSLFSQLATIVSFGRCSDPAFAKFKATLRNWFSK